MGGENKTYREQLNYSILTETQNNILNMVYHGYKASEIASALGMNSWCLNKKISEIYGRIARTAFNLGLEISYDVEFYTFSQLKDRIYQKIELLDYIQECDDKAYKKFELYKKQVIKELKEEVGEITFARFKD